MRHHRSSSSPRLLMALALAALTLGFCAAGASAVTLSPELQALEEKSKELKIASERFTIDYLVKAPSGKVVSVTGAGEERTSPPRAQVQETVKGKKVVVRVVGSTLYTEYPGLARVDQDRPWVRSSASRLSSESGIDFLSGASRFTATYALLGSEAEAVERVGPASVNGQEATEFTATVSLARLTSQLSASVRSELERDGVNTARVAVFIAADGLPLQSIVNISAEGGTVTVSTTVLQVNGKVSVSAPPAGRTISEARFKALEKRLKG